jgi:hypothetical protein
MNRSKNVNTIAYPHRNSQEANDRIYIDLYPSNLNNIQYPRRSYSAFQINDANRTFANNPNQNEQLSNQPNLNINRINVKPFATRQMSSDLPTYEQVIKNNQT